MKRKVYLAAVSITGFLITIFVPLQLRAQANPIEKEFVSGGRIEMHLDGGDYEVRPSATNRIRVTLSGNIGNAKVVLNTNGTHADLAVTDTPHNNFHAVIEVPAAADLRIQLTAGNLVTGAIRGNKDISSHAGNAEISVGDPKDYLKVDASVNAGNIDAGVFGSSTGGLFRSFKWSGPGKFLIHAHLGAGNLTLQK
ncbi:MAG TPA: hypothetical protein VJ723_04780 [Candidatus Angelobacter sp.]|nr:hypothetical protein [Candidatus Angelobacter sp.]